MPTFLDFSNDAFKKFAEDPRNYRTLTTETIRLNGVPLRIERLAESLVAHYAPSTEPSASAPWRRFLRAIRNAFDGKQKKLERAAVREGELAATRATELLREHGIFRRSDPIRAMADAVMRMHFFTTKGIQEQRSRSDEQGKRKTFLGALLGESADRASRLAQGQNAQALLKQRLLLEGISADPQEARKLKSCLDDATLCGTNFLGFCVGETFVEPGKLSPPLEHTGIGISLLFADDGDDRFGRRKVTISKGEPKVETRRLTADERAWYMSRAAHIRIELNDTPRANGFARHIEQLREYDCLGDVVNSFMDIAGREAQRERFAAPPVLDPQDAIRLARQQWTHCTDTADRVFQLANALVIGEMEPDQVAVNIPSIFAPLFIDEGVAPGHLEGTRQRTVKLRDPARFAALADKREAFYAELYNNRLQSEYLPYPTATPMLLREALRLPMVFQSDEELVGRLQQDGQFEPVDLLLSRGIVRVAAQNYALTVYGEGIERTVTLQALSGDGASVPGLDDRERSLGAILTTAARLAARREAALDDFETIAGKALVRWRDRLDRLPADSTLSAEQRHQLMLSGSYSSDNFSHLSDGPGPEVFTAVFRRANGDECSVVLPAVGVPGELAGETLKARITTTRYDKLQTLAAKWTFEHEALELQRELRNAFDDIVERTRPDGLDLDAWRDKLVQRVSDSRVGSLRPFSDEPIRALLDDGPHFRTHAEARAFLERPENRGFILRSGGLYIGQQAFHARITETGRIRLIDHFGSWKQSILSLFGLDDASQLSRIIP